MDDLATARASIKGTEKANELKQLLTIEQQRTVARNIKKTGNIYFMSLPRSGPHRESTQPRRRYHHFQVERPN